MESEGERERGKKQRQEVKGSASQSKVISINIARNCNTSRCRVSIYPGSVLCLYSLFRRVYKIHDINNQQGCEMMMTLSVSVLR